MTMSDYQNNLKAKADCEGNQEKCNAQGCPLFGTLGVLGRDGNRRIKGCGDPTARGKRNRSKGDNKARKARKALGIGGVNSRHEEHWGGAVRVEVKAGAQINPIATRYLLAEQQSEAQRPIGDHRPFMLVAMPDGMSDGLIVMKISSFVTLTGIGLETQ
jgi:hypothetical protein